jgi:hypothetical protein
MLQDNPGQHRVPRGPHGKRVAPVTTQRLQGANHGLVRDGVEHHDEAIKVGGAVEIGPREQVLV